MRRRPLPFLFALFLISTTLVATSYAAPFAYISNQDSTNVSVIDMASNRVTATIPVVGVNPQGLAVNPAGTRAYVANMDSNDVSVIDTVSNTVIKTEGVGSGPMRVTVHPSGAKVYVSNAWSGTVSVIDAATNKVVDTIATGGQPRGIRVNPAGTKVYVANFKESGSVFVIDTADNTVTKTIPVAGNSPIDLAITPDGSKVYVLNYYSNNVSVINTASDTEETATIAVGANPIGVWVNPAGTRVFLTNVTSGNVMVIDPSTNGVTDTITGFNAPVSIEGSPNGSFLYVVEQLNNRVSVLNAADYSVVTNVPVGSGPRSYNGNFIASPPPITEGLVSFWRGENNPFDVVGVNHGTWSGTAAYGIGQIGNAFSFDGASSHVATSDMDNEAISVSFWFKRNSMPHQCGGLVTKMMDGDLSAWAIYLNGDRIHVRTDTTGSGQQYLESSTVFSSGVWYHVAFVYDKATVRLYVNGVLDQTQAAGAILNGNDYPVTLGSGANGGNLCTQDSHFNGLIDDVAIYNRALSPKEVLSLVDLNRPGSWWKGENNALDSVGANNGTLQGATFATGKIGQAFIFDGVDDYMTVPASSTWAFGTGDFAISFWAYGTTFDDHRPLINNRKTPASNNMWAIEIYPVANRVEFHSGLQIFLEATNLLINSSWNHIAVTRSGSTLSMYINGVPSGSISNSSDFSEINDLQIGTDVMSGNQLGGRSFPGLIDDVRIFNRAISAGEVSLLASVPNAFSFVLQTGMPLSTWIVSNPITITGINQPAAISIAGGEYSISTDGATWGGWTNGAGTVSANNQVRVRQTSSSNYSATTTATLTIDEVSGTFSVTTAATGDPNSNGLISWWRGDDSPFDSVGGNHGTPAGNLSYAVGHSGQAFSLDGNTYIHIATATPLDRMPQLTLSAWLKIRGSHGAGTHLISGRAAGTQLYTDASGYLVFNIYDGASWHPVTSKAPLPLETWVHVAGTLNAGVGESNLYINGVLDGSASISTLPVENSNPFNIGGFTGYGSYLNGLIDEVKLYNRTLSDIEVGKMYGSVPDSFSFNPVTGANLSTPVPSNAITISGTSQPAPISITGGEYEIGGNGSWRSTPSTVNPGASVRVRLTSSSSYSGTKTATLTIGGRDGTFSVTTLADTEKPVVTAFSIAETESFDMTVDVEPFTAMDNSGIVSGYLITSSATPPSPSDEGWSATAPTSVILATAGNNTLYAWAKDPAGNVSDPVAGVEVFLRPVRRGTSSYTYYDSLSVACGEALTGESIRTLAVTVPGNVTLSGGKSQILSGGYDDGYGSQSGFTAIQGTLTVGTGTLTVERVVVR
jgi:YVTN family beta-propeller protein